MVLVGSVCCNKGVLIFSESQLYPCTLYPCWSQDTWAPPSNLSFSPGKKVTPDKHSLDAGNVGNYDNASSGVNLSQLAVAYIALGVAARVILPVRNDTARLTRVLALIPGWRNTCAHLTAMSTSYEVHIQCLAAALVCLPRVFSRFMHLNLSRTRPLTACPNGARVPDHMPMSNLLGCVPPGAGLAAWHFRAEKAR